MPERSPDQATKEQLREYRRVAAAAVSELRSAEIRNTYAALSMEELVDQRIEHLTGGTGSHPSRLARLTQVRDDLKNSLEGIKATPPSAFRRRSNDDANTEP